MSYQEFEDSFVEILLWSSNDESDESGGKPLDENYVAADFAPEAMQQIQRDCKKFYDEYSDVWFHQCVVQSRYSEDELAGRDFCLSRNGHGAGFWDGDWSEEVGNQLDKAAEKFGEIGVYVGDDGLLYTYGGP